MEITELRIQVTRLERVTLEGSHPGAGGVRILATLVVHSAVTDRLLVSTEAVRVLNVGR